MRILYFTRDFSVHDARFIKKIADAGHQVFLLRLEGLSTLPQLPVSAQDINWLGTNKPYQFYRNNSYVEALQYIWKTTKPDLIHAGPVHSAGYLAAHCRFHPLVTMSWGADLLWYAKRNWLIKKLAVSALKGTDIFMGDCTAVKYSAVKLGFNQEKIVLFPWGVDLQRFTPKKESSIRQQLNWQDKFVIFSNRSWEPIYGVDILVRSFVEAVKKIPFLRLILAGSGSQGEKIKRIIQKHSAQDIVFMPGRISQDDLPDYYHAADCFISASYCDGSSVSLLEAMACGLPVIVSNIAGNLEWINHGENGWLFNTGDPKDLALKILEVSTQEKTVLRKIAGFNRAIAEQRADWNKNSRLIFKAYDMAIDSNGDFTA